MNSYDSFIARKLAELIAAERIAVSERIAGGHLPDWSAYKFEAGTIRGLDLAASAIEDAIAAVEGRAKDRK